MGYSTDFTGELKFKTELTGTQLAKLKTFMGADCREHPEWGKTNLSYIDLKINDSFSGIEWDESEKTYDLVDKINLVISEMQKEMPDFELEGIMMAQGEDREDQWMIKIEEGKAVKADIVLKGKKVTCPECGEHFRVETFED